MRKIIIWLPWVLLIALAWYCFLSPKKGIIGLVELPEDDAVLSHEPVQWWYWTGHLKTVDTEKPLRFGFETVFFTFSGLHSQLVQVSITDVDKDSFHFKEYVLLSLPEKIPNQFNLKAGPNDIILAKGGDGKDHLHSEVDDYVLDLELTSLRKPVLHYGGDAHPYVFGGYTYYYSRERMSSKGTLKVGDKTYKVEGNTWFDRQYGELFQAIVKGWQWFAIELEDETDIMLFDFRGKFADVEMRGSFTDKDNNTRILGPNDFNVKVLDKWTSPNTGCVYPSKWDITIGDLKLTVKPLVADQELRANHDFWAGPEYWEGACSVEGDIKGQAYVELNGYCRSVVETIESDL